MFMSEEFLRGLPPSKVGEHVVGTDVFFEMSDIYQVGITNRIRAILAGYSVNHIGTLSVDLAFPVDGAPGVYVVVKDLHQRLLPPAVVGDAPENAAEQSSAGIGRGLLEPTMYFADDVVAPASPPPRRAWKPAIVSRVQPVEEPAAQPTPVDDADPLVS